MFRPNPSESLKLQGQLGWMDQFCPVPCRLPKNMPTSTEPAAACQCCCADCCRLGSNLKFNIVPINFLAASASWLDRVRRIAAPPQHNPAHQKVRQSRAAIYFHSQIIHVATFLACSPLSPHGTRRLRIDLVFLSHSFQHLLWISARYRLA